MTDLTAVLDRLRAGDPAAAGELFDRVYAELKRHGDPVTATSLDLLRSLRSRYDFVVVDCENIHAWGGTDYDWKNATHVDQFNMRRMLRYVLAQSRADQPPVP